MASALGIALTNLTSKAGILSRKACMRYAEETGKKLVDKSRELGRNLNQTEVEQVFAEHLPKRCIPKILSTQEQAAKCLVNTGFSEEAAMETFLLPGLGAATVMDGFRKYKIYIPFGNFNNSNICQFYIAHELEHALECNCKPVEIFKRLKNALKYKFMSKFDKNYIDKKSQKDAPVLGLQAYMQGRFGTFNFLTENPMDNVLKIKPTRQDYAEFTGNETEKRFMVILRDYIRTNFASSKVYDKDNSRKLKKFIQVTDKEIPAHTVQGNVERYALNLTQNQTPKATANTYLYEDAAKIMKRERFLYLKNRLTGKVRKTPEYKGEKSLFKLTKNPDDKQILTELIKDMGEKEKRELYYAMLHYPETLHNLNVLVNATKISGKSMWIKFPGVASEMNPKAVENKDFLKIISLKNPEYIYPDYMGCLAELSHLSPEQLAKFVKLADRKGADGVTLKYHDLYKFIDNPNFETIKKVADIEVGGENPYANYIYFIMESVTAEQFDKIYKIISKLAKNGKKVEEELGTSIYKKDLDGFFKKYDYILSK